MSPQVATIVSITGDVSARAADGTIRVLTEGDTLYAGEVLITSDGSQVVLDYGNGELVSIAGPQDVLMSEAQITASVPEPVESEITDPSVDAILAALEGDGDLLDDLEAPAAGTEGAPDGGGGSFVRLMRISETVDPLAFQFEQQTDTPFDAPIGDAGPLLAEEPVPPSVSPEGGSVNETGGFDSFTQSLGVSFGGLTGTITLSAPGAVWNAAANTLTYGPDSYGGSWQIQVNPDGTYTFEQTGAMEHPETSDPNDSVPVEVTVTVVSENGLTAESSFIVDIFDDGPSILELNTDVEGLQLNVFDAETLSEEGSTDSVDLSELFSVDVDYGTDGPGSLSWSYALGLVPPDLPPVQLPGGDFNDFPPGFEPIIVLPEGVYSGLSSYDLPIMLTLSEDQQSVVGFIMGEGPETVFTLEIIEGQLVLTQFLPIDHLLNGEPVDQLNLGSLVTLTGSVTVTDRDGDSVSQSTEPLNLGEFITFNDDEPAAELDGAIEAVEGGDEVTGTWSTDPGADSDGASRLLSINGGPADLLVVGEPVDTGVGILTFNADGTWSFVAATNLDHSESDPTLSFQLIKIDGDLDEADATHTITIVDGDGPTPGGEDGVGSSVGLVTTDVDLRDSLVSDDSGLLTFTAGSDDIASFVFGDTSGISVDGLDGTLTWLANAEGDELIGSLDGVDVLKLTLSGSPVAAGDTGSVTVNVEQLASLPHNADVDELEISGIQVKAIDSDGTESASASVSVIVHDDLPEVTLDGAVQATEGGDAISGTWSTEAGADSAGATRLLSINGADPVSFVVGDAINTGVGILTFNADGTWSFVAATNLDHSESDPTLSFQLIKIDGDLDEADATHTITIVDGDGPTPGGEDGVGSSVGLVTTDVDLRDSLVSDDSGLLTFTAGSDDIASFVFGDTSGISVDGLDGTLTWLANAEGDELIGSLDGVDVLKLTLSGSPVAAGDTGSVTVNVEQLASLPHNADVDELEISGIQVKAIDSDGTESASASVSVTVHDDLPAVEGTDPSGHEVTITNLGSNPNTGYNNSFGYYVVGEDGEPTIGVVLWSNVKLDVNDIRVITGYAPGEIGYFIIPNGATHNPDLGNDTSVVFQSFVNSNGDTVWQAWTADENGDPLEPLAGQNSDMPALFSDGSLHPNGTSHVENNLTEGDLNWEDIYGDDASDYDFNDVNINVTWSDASLTVSENTLDQVASFDFSTYFSAEFGADLQGLPSVYSLGVTQGDGSDSGLIDTQTGEPVLLRMDGEAVQGYVWVDGVETPVFTVTVDSATGVVTLDQLRAVEHPLGGVVGASDVVNIAAGAIDLTKTVYDSDSDTDTATIDIGPVMYFQDAGPDAADFVYDDAVRAGADPVVLATGMEAIQQLLGFDAGPDGLQSISFGAGSQGGLLLINDDGELVYTPPANVDQQNVSETFSYTVMDGDGDTATALITFNVRADSQPEVGSVEITLDEANLPNGTQTNLSELTRTGTFSVVAADGIKDVTLDGEYIIQDGVYQPGVSLTVGGGTLTITGFDADTGLVSYQYVLDSSYDHQPVQGTNTKEFDLEIAVTDIDDDVVTGNFRVNIIDDVPEFGTPDDVSVSAAGGEVSGDLNLNIGADETGGLISDVQLLSEDGFIQVQYLEEGVLKTVFLTSGGEKLNYTYDEATQQLIAYKASETADDPVFTIDMSVETDTYTLTVLQPLDGVAQQFSTSALNPTTGGIDGSLELDSPNLNVTFTAVGGSVNFSPQSIGVADQHIEAGESLTAIFDQFLSELVIELSPSSNASFVTWTAINTQTGESFTGTGLTIDAFAPGAVVFDKVVFENSGSGQGNQKYGIKGFSGEYLDSELEYSLPVDVVSKDGDGDVDDASFLITFEPAGPGDLPDLPSILGLTDSDVLVNEAYLENGSGAATGAFPADSNSFTLVAPAGVQTLLISGLLLSGQAAQSGSQVALSAADLAVLGLPSATPVVVQTPEGNELQLTAYNPVTGEVSYTFVLTGALEHDEGEGTNLLDKADIDLALLDTNGHYAYGTINVTVVDDIPEQFSLSNDLTVAISEVLVGGLNANWSNPVGGSSSLNNTAPGTDDVVRWGSGSNYSNYTFDDNNDLIHSDGVQVNEPFVIGSFTHNNFTIQSGTSISAVDLQLSFNVVIDGVVTPITHTINFKHNETPNTNSQVSHPDNDDIVTILNAGFTTSVTVGARVYNFEVVGFVDKNTGNVVNSVRTTEQASNTFELLAKLSSTDDLPKVEGQVETGFGADGAALINAILWDNGDGAGTAVASGTIAGNYGYLEVAADGTYTYVMSREARDGMLQDENLQETFTYYLTDADGDQVSSTLTINLQAAPNVPVNILESTPGDDTLAGEDGVADIFVWSLGDEGEDTVLNFNPTDGDVLDLADLLVGEESGLITDYISISEINGGSDTVISLTPTGAGGDVSQTITLQGVSFTDLGIDTATMTSDEAIITHLVESGYINIDQ